ERDGAELFREMAARNGLSVRHGNSVLANMVVSGEIPLALAVYSHMIEEAKAQAAPVDWLALEPLVARVDGAGVSRQPPHPHAAQNSSASVGATVIHPERELPAAVERDRTVLITGNRIVRIGPRAGTRVPAGAQRIDGKGKWVVPGLVDAHVHFFQSGNLYTRPDVADFNAVVPYAEEVAGNKARLPATFKLWLASGVTSVVDIGGPYWNFEMRDAARRSSAAPRVAVAGPLISM